MSVKGYLHSPILGGFKRFTLTRSRFKVYNIFHRDKDVKWKLVVQESIVKKKDPEDFWL